MTTVLVCGPAGAGGARLATRLGTPKTLRVVVGAVELSLDEQIDTVQPDVVLVDLGAARVGAWLRDLGTLRLPPAVVMLTDDPRPALGVELLRRGGRAILPRHASSEEIVAAIEAVAAGLVVLHPEAMKPYRGGHDWGATRPDHDLRGAALSTDGPGNKGRQADRGCSAFKVPCEPAS